MDWYYSKGSNRVGPLPLEALVDAAQSGTLQPADYVWSDGMPAWVPADSVPDLFSTATPHPLLARIVAGPGDQPLVVGKSLLVVSGTTLPPRCIKTKRPLSQTEMVRKQFSWCSPWWGLTVFLGFFAVIVVYFLVRKKCVLTYGLSSEQRRKYQIFIGLKVLAAVGFFLGLMFSTLSHSGVVIATMVILFIVSLIVALVGNQPLAIRKYEEGRFWLNGCSPEYLAAFVTT